jgi:predicted small lipoprotein YifL
MIRVLMIILLFASLGVSACGKKGPLDPPPDEQQQQEQQP